jgi:hypothetical protein
VQRVEPGSSDRRRLTLIAGTFRVQASLGKSWKVFSELEHEWSISRQLLDDYEVNTVSAGVDFEF